MLLSAIVAVFHISHATSAHAQIDFRWNNVGGGEFNNPNNWSSLFPGAIPDQFVRTIFDQPHVYTVTFPSNQSVNSASIRSGNVSFDLGGQTFAHGELVIAELANDVAELTILNGTIDSARTILGDTDPSLGSLVVDGNGRMLPNSMTIGRHAVGVLVIRNGGRVDASGVQLGTELSGNGTLRVVGEDELGNRSRLACSRGMTVGSQGRGEMHITGGALVESNPAAGIEESDEIGLFPAPAGSGLGAVGLVTIDGVGGSGIPSTWTSTGPLFLGNVSGGSFSQGIMVITAGAQAFHAKAQLLGSADFASRVEIHGTDALNNPSRWTVNSGSVDCGGEIFVTDGGAFESAGGMTIGFIDDIIGRVIIDGTSQTGVRSRYTGNGFSVGTGGVGEVIVANGAIADLAGTGSINAGTRTSGHGSVTITGKDAFDNPSTLIAGRTIVIGLEGSASLTVSDGGVLKTGFDDPFSSGLLAARESADPVEIHVIGEGSSWTHARSLTVGGTAADPGGFATVTIGDGAMVDIGGTMKIWSTSDVLLSGGSLVVDSLDVSDGDVFDFIGGILSANHIVGNLINKNGTVAAGRSAGTTMIEGDYEQLGNGKTAIEIAETEPDTRHTRLDVTGAAILAGTLVIAFHEDFVPVAGDTFELIAATAVSGAFDHVILEGFPSDMHIRVTYDTNSVTAEVSDTRFGDCVVDGVINLLDFETLQRCMTGPVGGFLDNGCRCADLDGDRDVDQVDFRLFQLEFRGT